MREVLSPSISPTWIGQLRKAIVWPAAALEARRVRAELAGLSERELSDIGGAPRDCGPAPLSWRDESSEERAARARAIRAWYGPVRRAA
jgi:uncharacterized protein YjiS (DUF1127 family)